jgi:hypothetical protein
MLNSESRKQAQTRLKKAAEQYEQAGEQLKVTAESLYQTRVNRGVETIRRCEDYINTLANKPKEFSKVVADLKEELQKIAEYDLDLIDANPGNLAQKAAGAGVMAGAGVACFGPGAAIAFATTFGTASTGTAIATLSGAAATNAALAWLGGGALVAGGGGMAAGNALLAMAGPIGWTIGGATLVGSGMWTNHKNKEIAREANENAEQFERYTVQVNTANQEVNLLERETVRLVNFIKQELFFFEENAPSNYLKFDESLKYRMNILINTIRSLSISLQKNIELNLN